MIVTARLNATLRRPTPDGYLNRLTVELEEGATVASLLDALGLDQDPQHLMILVNRRQVDLDHVLSDGDEVHLFPPLSGGKTKACVVPSGAVTENEN